MRKSKSGKQVFLNHGGGVHQGVQISAVSLELFRDEGVALLHDSFLHVGAWILRTRRLVPIGGVDGVCVGILHLHFQVSRGIKSFLSETAVLLLDSPGLEVRPLELRPLQISKHGIVIVKAVFPKMTDDSELVADGELLHLWVPVFIKTVIGNFIDEAVLQGSGIEIAFDGVTFNNLLLGGCHHDGEGYDRPNFLKEGEISHRFLDSCS